MKGFEIDEKGDVVIRSDKIQMVDNNELLRQKIQTVLSTNINEWFLNKKEGINFNNILGKKKSDDIIRNEIMEGLRQVDSFLVLEKFNCDFNEKKRKLSISFEAKTGNGDNIEVNIAY